MIRKAEVEYQLLDGILIAISNIINGIGAGVAIAMSNVFLKG